VRLLLEAGAEAEDTEQAEQVDPSKTKAAQKDAAIAGALHAAMRVAKISTEVVSLLLQAGANANDGNDLMGVSLLYLPMRSRHKFMYDERLGICTYDENAMSPMHMAAWRGHGAAVAVLLRAGADVTKGKYKGKCGSPLHCAAEGGHKHVVSMLLEAGANVNAIDYSNCTPLYRALRGRRLAAATELLKAGADVNVRELFNSRTPLHIASSFGSKVLVSLLLEAGADIIAQDIRGIAPLHFAATHGNMEAVLALLGAAARTAVNGCEPTNPKTVIPRDYICSARNHVLHAKDKSGRTALHSAVSNGRTNIVSLLLEAGADVNAEDDACMTPLHYAMKNMFRKDMLAALLNAGADINARDKRGSTALHFGTNCNNEDAMSMLLKAGANVNAKDDDARTPLHCAALKFCSEKIVALLLEAGADINATDNRGSTPLHDASRENRYVFVSILLQAGADIDATDDKGETPLHCAAKSPGTLKLLQEASAKLQMAQASLRNAAAAAVEDDC
jgi:cytohesin